MESINIPDMLRLLDKEAIVLNQMHRKISIGLNRLQLQSEIFMRTLVQLGRTQIPSTKVEEDAVMETDEDPMDPISTTTDCQSEESIDHINDVPSSSLPFS
eukprot:c21219_g1_i3 orf=327-629(+)